MTMPIRPRTHNPSPQHKARVHSDRPTTAARGYDARWQAFSRNFRRMNPLCVECMRKGITAPADVVDHIVALRQGGAKYDMDNLQPLCHQCHGRKTVRETR